MFDSKECEWNDLEIFIDGVKLGKVQGLKYSRTQEKEVIHAAGNEPLSVQRGNVSYEGEITILKGLLDDLNKAARASGGSDILDISVVVIANYRAKGARLIQTDSLLGVEFTKYEKGMEQGAKSMPITLPIIFLGLTSI
jgi:hypothetical protein